MFPQFSGQDFQHALPSFPFGLVGLAHGRDYTVWEDGVGWMCRLLYVGDVLVLI